MNTATAALSIKWIQVVLVVFMAMLYRSVLYAVVRPIINSINKTQQLAINPKF